MFRKKLFVIGIVLAVIVTGLGVTSMVLWLPRSAKKIVPLEVDGIIKIIEVPPNASGYPQHEKALDSNYYEEFIRLARSAKYVKNHNIMGWKKYRFASVRYFIYYESGLKITVTDAYYARNDITYARNGSMKFVLFHYLTQDPFDEIEQLFEMHNTIT